ncbi:SpoIIE family protein phosphatase [Streptomyces polyrhachis]|uniref:SpoIIE family protein phosphatase n=1 Tax=Streptomyces polyrhachis TaxID=1282885 RepID=A0ABW2GLG9_9ACTN
MTEPLWQSSPPGSIYDHIQVASFCLGPDGRIEQWSDRAAELFGVPAERALGADPVTTLIPPGLRHDAARSCGPAAALTPERVLDGREWIGLVPYGRGDEPEGITELYVMPTRTADGRRGALCVAVDVYALRRIETDLAASQAIFGQSPMGFLLFGTDLRLIRVNERFATAFGRPADAHIGRGAADYLPRAEAERFTAACRQVLETGEPVTDMQILGPSPAEPQRQRWAVSLYRVHSAAGRPMGVAAIANDVTGRRRAETEAANARRNLALLNEAGARIGNTLDLETTARELLDVTVPQFCDLACVDLYQSLLDGDEGRPGLADGSAELRRVAFASAVSDAPVTAVGATHRLPFHSPYAAALRTAQVQFVPAGDVGEEEAGGAAGPVRATLAVPLVAGDTVVGLVQFSRTKGSEGFGERDIALAVQIAARAAVCIDNARLYRREHARALILQRSLLPPGEPQAAGLDIACRYLPGNTATEVGGDWFDVIELPGHRTALVVGDVMGRGLRAAVAMGELRTAVRTLALLDLEPADVLTALDEIASGLGDVSEVYLATCVYAVYDSVTRRCVIANAGHLPPMLVEPGETPLLLEVPTGMPLGVGGEPFEEVEVELPEGAMLALYTDGLVESRDHPLDEGLEVFRKALTGSPRALEDACDHVLDTLHTRHGEDDVALLMARVCGLPVGSVGDWRLDAEPKSVARARELARAQLLAWGLEALVDTSELLVSELVTNALRHGEGEIRLRLLLGRTLVCEVWDAALRQPRRRRARDTDEGGRGLQLVSLLSSSWGSRRTPQGKTVWFELDLPGEGTTPSEATVEALLSVF